MILRRSVHGVLGQLANEGLLTDAQLEAARAAASKRPVGTPWFVRALVGAGAWVASLLVLLFLSLAGLLEGGAAAMLPLGVTFYGGAAALRRFTRGDFPVQLSLSLGLAGAGMVIFGLLEGTSRSAAAALVASLVVALLTVLVFPDLVMRFLGAAGACLALVLLFHELELGPDAAVAVIGVLAGLAWHFEARLLAQPFTRALQRPVAWGLLVSFLGAMLTTLGDDRDFLRVGPWASASASVALAALLLAVAKEHRAKLASEPVLVALGVAGALGGAMLHSPGVPAALYAMLLAFHRRSPLMLGLAVVSLVAFLVNFYFRMELTLLSRSLVLLASGALLLAAREYLRRRFGPIVVEELP